MCHSWDRTVSSNAVGFKSRFGKDTLDGAEWECGKPLSVGSDSKIGQHADCQLLAEGGEVVQASSNSADGGHPTAAVTIGGARDLIFLRQERRGGRKKLATKVTSFQPGQNSLLILLPWWDEVPMKCGGAARRKVHKAAFCSGGVSVAMVFQCASEQATGCVERESGLWAFDKESTLGRSLKRSEREFSKIAAIG